VARGLCFRVCRPSVRPSVRALSVRCHRSAFSVRFNVTPNTSLLSWSVLSRDVFGVTLNLTRPPINLLTLNLTQPPINLVERFQWNLAQVINMWVAIAVKVLKIRDQRSRSRRGYENFLACRDISVISTVEAFQWHKYASWQYLDIAGKLRSCKNKSCSWCWDHRETSICGMVQSIRRYILNRLGVTHECDRQTDGQTDRRTSLYRVLQKVFRYLEVEPFRRESRV